MKKLEFWRYAPSGTGQRWRSNRCKAAHRNGGSVFWIMDLPILIPPMSIMAERVRKY